MLSTVGFILVIAMVALIIWGRVALPPILIILPTIAVIILGLMGYLVPPKAEAAAPMDLLMCFKTLQSYLGSGLSSVLNTAALFTFAVVFFNILGDAGMFDFIVSKVMKYIGNNISLILLMTCLLCAISHLDGSGATTMLITIPTMLPLFKKMRVSPVILLIYVGLVSGVENMLPWTSALARVPASTGVEAREIWSALLPTQVVGMVLLFASCFVVGPILKKKGFGMTDEEFAELKSGMLKLNDPVLKVSNISFARESVINEGFAMANAARNCGGIVIVQVEYLAKKETLPAKEIKIPGTLLDYVVQAQDPKSCWQAEGDYWEPSFSGEIRKPLSSIEPLPLDERKVICRRCAMELRKGDLINLGVGIPADIAKVVNEEGLIDQVTMSTESGMVGGVPSARPSFGSAYNPEAIITPNEMFNLISGGGLNMTCLGIGEVDRDGNNNVSRMGSRLIGPGGFIDITSNTPKVVFAGTLVGKAKVKVGGGRLEILEEGTICKFVDQVGQITFSGKYAPDTQEVLYVTERAVFKLINHELTLTEIAPGIDLERDVLAQMGFRPAISPDLKTMDPALFQEHWGKLGDALR